MIDYETFCKIKSFHKTDGLNCAQIARALDLGCRTVKRHLMQTQFQPRRASIRRSKLDPFKDEILRMLERHPYSAMQIYQMIGGRGFDGGCTIVKEYVRKVRPKRNRAFLKLSFEPGECAQADWSCFGSVPVDSTRRRLSFFVMVLCYSCMMYVQFSVFQTMEHFLDGHQNAFAAFGGDAEKNHGRQSQAGGFKTHRRARSGV